MPQREGIYLPPETFYKFYNFYIFLERKGLRERRKILYREGLRSHVR